MKIYDYGFVGHKYANLCLPWFGMDSQDNFVSNTEKHKDKFWSYSHVPITYNFNELGHRSKKLSDVNFENYILCTGCSNTMGIGVEEHTTYPAILAEKLGCDYYNLGIAASSIDILLHNLVIWYSVLQKLPKVLVIQWPDQTRTISGSSEKNLIPLGLWTNNPDYDRYVDIGLSLNIINGKKILANQILKSLYKTSVVYFNIEKTIPFNDATLTEKQIDNARDMSHPGIESHQLFAKVMYDYLINNECLNFYQNPEEKS